MRTLYYIAHEDDDSPAVYLIDGEWLGHTVPDWELIEDGPARIWKTRNRREAYDVARRFGAWGARVVPYSVA